MINKNQHTQPNWQDIFNDAAIPPPENIWVGVERALDEEKIWKTAFEDTEIAPTPALWTKIEAELESKKRRGIILWLKSNSLRIAATVLLSLFSYQLSMNSYQLSVSSKQLAVKSYQLAVISKQLAIRQKGDKAQGEMLRTPLSKQSDGVLDEPINNTQLPIRNKAIEKKGELLSKTLLTPPLDQSENDSLRITHYALLSSKSFTLNPQSSILNPNFLNFPEYQDKKPKKNKKEYWFAIASGAAPFNPNLDFTGVQSMASAAFMNEDIFNNTTVSVSGAGGNVNTSKAGFPTENSPINESKSGVSLQFGFISGMSLTKKISIETGLQVIKGNSTIVSNTFLIDLETSETKNIYELATSKQTNDEIMAKNIGAILEDQVSQNNYTFLQVPVRLGYQVWQKDKINITVLGGASLDILSTNIMGNILFENSNSPYKTLNMSALVGVRANYQVYKNWYWGMGLNYQQAILPNNKPDALLGMKMKFGGINMGLQYKFKNQFRK